MADQPELRACTNTRCRRKVFDAKIIKTRGVPVDIVVDAAPSTWAEGARIKLLPSEHLPHQLVEKLTAAQIHRAFAVHALYVEHREMCQGAQRRTAAKKRSDTHA
jgi:hypothetical protein